MIAISRNGKHLGSIVADRIIKDEFDNYLLFMDGSKVVAYFSADNIEISTENVKVECVSDFAVYQSNRV